MEIFNRVILMSPLKIDIKIRLFIKLSRWPFGNLIFLNRIYSMSVYDVYSIIVIIISFYIDL